MSQLRSDGRPHGGADNRYDPDPAKAAAKQRRGNCIFMLLVIVVVFLAAGIYTVVRNAHAGKYSQAPAQQVSSQQSSDGELPDTGVN